MFTDTTIPTVITRYTFSRDGAQRSGSTQHVLMLPSDYLDHFPAVYYHAPDGLTRAAMNRLSNSSDPLKRSLVATQPNLPSGLVRNLATDTDLNVVHTLGLNDHIDESAFRDGFARNPRWLSDQQRYIDELSGKDPWDIEAARDSMDYLMRDLVLLLLPNPSLVLVSKGLQHEHVAVRQCAQEYLARREIKVVNLDF